MCFIVGSTCFLVGPIPAYVHAVGSVGSAWTFVVGALFFTSASSLQLFLASTVPSADRARGDRLNWWAAAVQWVGTVLFNVSTIAALIAAVRQPDAAGAGWTANAEGSVAFLVSSALAVGALARGGSLRGFSRSAATGWLNLLGSIAFGISAVGAWVAPDTQSEYHATWAGAGTSAGALCFLLAATLTLPRTSFT